jgi:hypothetical protein
LDPTVLNTEVIKTSMAGTQHWKIGMGLQDLKVQRGQTLNCIWKHMFTKTALIH